jgi:SAM-dependent methyltransferase
VDYTERKCCSLCGYGALELCLDLPNTPIANEFVASTKTQETFPLFLVMCEKCRHLQSGALISPDRLFHDYVYASSTSPLTVEHLRNQARTIDAVLGLRRKEKCFIVEVGSNDGTLLQQFAELGIPKAHLLGIEPAKEIADFACRRGLRTHIDFFSLDYGRHFRQTYTEPDVVIANNVFAHVHDVRDVLLGVKAIVGDTGILVMEVAHAMDLLNGAWDTIYHEHLSHHAFTPLMNALDNFGLPVFDVDVIPSQVGRGSLRVWAGNSRVRTNETSGKIRELLQQEDEAGLMMPNTWRRLASQICEEGSRVRRALQEWQGKEIWGYGAPAKMTTLMYSYGLDKTPIRKIADDSPLKQGRLAPGTHIPIGTIDELVKEDPDLVIVFAWNFADDIRKKLRERGYQGQISTPQELAQ